MPKIDVTTPLTQIEAGRVKTILQGRGIRLLYRELTGFGPSQIAETKTCKSNGITAKAIAEAANRGASETEE